MPFPSPRGSSRGTPEGGKGKVRLGSGGMPFGAASRSLADQFVRQKAEALRYADKFDMAVEATLPLDPDEEPESPPPSP